MDDMLALARVLSNLVYLENLAFVQSFPPQMPEDNFILLMPYLASNSLRKLHWDITSHPTCAIAADSILARSIAAKGFPALRILRAPNDPEGIFQVLCRPRDRVDLPGDRFRPVTPTRATGATARLAAQARLEAAWRFPRFHVNVIDERGMLVDKFGLAGFMGTAESKIRYDLSPDPGARDENGGLIEIGDVTGDCGEKEGDMCNGRWNVHATPTDKKDKDRWWHVERGRWTGVEM
ncbi:unnamed protein product [Parascedosporium putredinis]|uniref:Uncharacterized protein n=1 Tax=Parascedosporium putredinis TaxID=1442378 RepID=A0A9P1H6P0_9PEZI|nr:unnamed protein product [Parascedosporium putredinis]CAI7998992.1 unnamed protein product [Parascedosporium putredinis]